MPFGRCPSCGESVSTHVAFCWNCGGSTIETQTSVSIKTQQADVLQLDCNACKTAKSMTATRVARFSGIVRTIGGILLVPSFLGLGFALLMFLSTIMVSSSMPQAHSEAERAGSAIGFGIGFVFSVTVGVISLVGGLLGWLLLQNRNVWKCVRCGYILDRA
jgi:hypothetical protein